MTSKISKNAFAPLSSKEEEELIALCELALKENKEDKGQGFTKAKAKMLSQGSKLEWLARFNLTSLTEEEIEREELFNQPKPDRSETLLLRYLDDYSPIRDIIASYNKVYDEIKKIVKNTILEMGNGQIITFDHVTIERPQDGSKPISPQQARIKKFNYFSRIVATVRIYSIKESEEYKKTGKLDSTKGYVSRNVEIDEVPCMLNSSTCFLTSYTGNNLAKFLTENGEDATDHFGYFVTNDGEHVIPNVEKLRVLKHIVHIYKGEIEGSLTIPKGWTSLMLNTYFDAEGNLFLKHTSIKTKDACMNIFHLLALLYCKEKNKRDQATIFQAYTQGERIIKSLCLEPASVASTIVIPYYNFDPFEAYSLDEDDLDILIETNLFPHIEDKKYNDKFLLLCVMAARMYMCKTGQMEPDNRDAWAHKRLQGAAKTVERYFARFWHSFTLRFTDATKSRSEVKEWPRLDDKIWKNFQKGFATGAWGEKQTVKKNVSQRAVRNNSLALMSQILTIDVQADKQNQDSVRAMQADQYGFICSTQTPEGKDTGIRKAKAITCRITDGVDEKTDAFVKARLLALDKEYNVGTTEEKCEGRYLVLYNFTPLMWSNSKVADYCRQQRRLGFFPRDMEVVLENKFIYIHTEDSRLVRPLLVIDEDHKLLIDRLNLHEESIKTIMDKGCLDFISPWEQNSLKVAIFPSDLKTLDEERDKMIKDKAKYLEAKDIKGAEEKIKEIDDLLAFKRLYTHCELDPATQFGIAAIFIPGPQHNPAARNVYQTSMNRQALTMPHSNEFNRYYPESKQLASISRPIFNIAYAEHFGLHARSHTTNVILAFGTGTSYTPFTDFEAFTQSLATPQSFKEIQAGKAQEDQITIKKEARDRGLFLSTIYHVYKATYQTSGNDREVIELPKPAPNEDASRYHALDESGLPIIGKRVKYRDCIIGKVLKKTVNKEVITENKSVYVERNVEGYIQNVTRDKDSNGNPCVTVKIAQTSYFNESNKIAAIPAQKGTVNFVKAMDMPYTKEGLVPDMIVNPHSIGSRQTILYILELLIGKYTMATGNKVDGTAFRKYDIPTIVRKLSQFGYQPMGYETMYDPTTGKALPNKVFLGVVSIQVLRHFADQKVQSRGWYGSVNSRTEQPNKPSSGPSAKMGGNKQGELEVDSAHAHGAAGFLNQVLSTLSDQAKIPLCQNCHSCLILKYDNNTYRCETCERDTKVYIVGHMRYATNYLKNVISPFVGMGMTWTTEARIRGRPRELREEEGEDEIEEEDDE